jgi:hypothetical protein
MSSDSNFTREADDRDLDAYNAAFYELGLRWHWDGATYEALLSLAVDGPSRIGHYLQTQQPHLLRAYDADFLVAMIERKTDAKRAAADATRQDGTASRFFDGAHARGCELRV